MFCPACRSEYRPGFDQCADCRVPLAEQLPPPVEPVQLPGGAQERQDSLNISFIKGALLGWATAEVLAALSNVMVRTFLMPRGFIVGPNPWPETMFLLISMLRPLGILLGGYLARSRRW